MSRLKQFKLPDLGEGLTEGEILQWMVQPGDEVRLNQPIVEVETAKAAVEVPSPYAGVVTEIHHEAGETVDVGAVIITFDTDPSAGPLPEAAGNAAAGAAANPVESKAGRDASAVGTVGEVAADTVPAGAAPEASEGKREAVLVGYGVKPGTAKRRARKDSPVAAAVPPVETPPPPATAARVSAAAVGQAAEQRAGAVTVLAKPPVRKLAKDLGVDLTTVVGSGPGGTITRADVEQAASGSERRFADYLGEPAAAGGEGWFASRGERETRIPIKGVRKMTASAMVASAFTAPHVTEFITFDMTPSIELVQRLRGMREFRDVKVTPLLLVAKALLLAVKRNPEINATWDDAAQEIVVKHYVNLGIAVASPRGLIVPNIKDADRMDLAQLAGALQDLVETARQGKTAPADMQHGTITITNVGTFGVDTGTPIINPGESAILCFGAVRPTPWVVDGQVVPRQVTQLSLSFDHRNVDGALGSQVLADVARVLSDPATALLWA